MTVNDIKVCEGLPAVGFPSPTSKGGRPVPNPVAGNGNDSNLNNTGSNGNYWSSTPNSDNSNNAWNLNFNSGNFNRNNNNRYNGQSVRPVRALATVPPGGTSHRLLEDLYRAYLAARRHKRNKGYQIRFEMRQERELVKLRDELLGRRYEPRPSSCFIIHDPKMREVFLLEKICLLNPLADCRVVGDTSEWRKLPTDKSLFAAKEGCGLPIGNLSSQLFSNIYLGMLDDFVKRELKVKHYGRYVDDMFIVGESKEYVKSLIEPIRVFLRDRLHLELSENKTKVCDARYGVEFLGAFIKPFRTYVSTHSLRRIRSHLHAVTPRMCARRAQAVVNSLLGVLSHYASHNLRAVLTEKSQLPHFGTISEDGLRYYPNVLDWETYRLKKGTIQ